MYTGNSYQIFMHQCRVTLRTESEYVKGCGPKSKPGSLETREEKLKYPNHSEFARPQQKAMTLREKAETRD